MALSVEAAELLEHFQWLTDDDSRELPQPTLSAVAEEIADVQIYLVRLADKLGIDILQATEAKIRINENKYPVGKVKGSSKKYTSYKEGDEVG
jgi:NTP pyrophosphatase (non-canonical NTP hydrolase)